MTTMWGAPLHKRWRGSRLRDPRQAKFLTMASLKWVIANRAYSPWYLVRYWRLLKFKLANPHIITRGMVFLGQGRGDSGHPRVVDDGDRPLGPHR